MLLLLSTPETTATAMTIPTFHRQQSALTHGCTLIIGPLSMSFNKLCAGRVSTILVQACFAVPTVIIPNTVLQPPLLQPFLTVLQQHLQAAGVIGIHEPTAAALQQQYIQHLYQDISSSSSLSSCSKGNLQQQPADGAALLRDSCNWVPSAAAAATVSGGSSGASSDILDSLPLPTRALLGAIVDHLQQHFARPEVRARPVLSALSSVILWLICYSVPSMLQSWTQS